MSTMWNQTTTPAARVGEFPWNGECFALRIDNELGNVAIAIDPEATSVKWALYGLPEAASRVQVLYTDGNVRVVGAEHHSWVGGLFWKSLTTRDGIDIVLVIPPSVLEAAINVGIGSLSVTGPVGFGRTFAKVDKGNISFEYCAAPSNGGTDPHRLKTGVGNIWIGTGQKLFLETGVGDVRITSLLGDASAKTGTGNILIDRMTAGSLQSGTGVGDIRVNVPAGTAAYLDCSAGLGEVKSDLQGSPEPAADTPQVSISARSGVGAVKIRYA